MEKLPRVEGVTDRINKYVKSLSCGKLFSTRDLLGFGKRGAVDQATHRAVEGGQWQRVARGVFCKKESAVPYMFDRIEVMKCKAIAFGKEVAVKHQFVKETKKLVLENARLFISGQDTEFGLRGDPAKLKLKGHRKIRVANCKGGDHAFAHWSHGKRNYNPKQLSDLLVETLSLEQLTDLCDQYRFLPAWINDSLATVRLSLSPTVA
jgi:hypothetical protein